MSEVPPPSCVPHSAQHSTGKDAVGTHLLRLPTVGQVDLDPLLPRRRVSLITPRTVRLAERIEASMRQGTPEDVKTRDVSLGSGLVVHIRDCCGRRDSHLTRCSPRNHRNDDRQIPTCGLHRYLSHKKPPTPLGPPYNPSIGLL